MERFCPVCGIRKTKATFCSSCGFDSSLDYDLYLTLGEGLPDVPTIEEQQKQYRLEESRNADALSRMQAYQDKTLEQIEQQIREGARSPLQQVWIAKVQEKLDELKEENDRLQREADELRAQIKAQNQPSQQRVQAQAQNQQPQQRETAQGESAAARTEGHAPLRTGSRVAFGSFPADRTGRREDIIWRVLTQDEQGHVLLMGEKAVECRPFDERSGNDWRRSGMRRWLNDKFFQYAFTASEQPLIETATVDKDHTSVQPLPDNSVMKFMNIMTTTYDKVFLLSNKEVETYLPDERDRVAVPTEYAIRNAASAKKPNGGCGWWLRTACNGDRESAVAFHGGITPTGYPPSTPAMAVRPAIWMNAEYAASRLV